MCNQPGDDLSRALQLRFTWYGVGEIAGQRHGHARQVDRLDACLRRDRNERLRPKAGAIAVDQEMITNARQAA